MEAHSVVSGGCVGLGWGGLGWVGLGRVGLGGVGWGGEVLGCLHCTIYQASRPKNIGSKRETYAHTPGRTMSCRYMYFKMKCPCKGPVDQVKSKILHLVNLLPRSLVRDKDVYSEGECTRIRPLGYICTSTLFCLRCESELLTKHHRSQQMMSSGLDADCSEVVITKRMMCIQYHNAQYSRAFNCRSSDFKGTQRGKICKRKQKPRHLIGRSRTVVT
jgi:hypothetical protein